MIIGVDEAGRGPLAGPIVAGALLFRDIKSLPMDLVDSIGDSKKLTRDSRRLVFDELVRLSTIDNPSVYIGIGIVDNYTIDEINIRQATKLAMSRALDDILRRVDIKNIKEILIDGNDGFVFEDISIKPKYIIKGDSKIKEISGASIIAKVLRDELMSIYSLVYPNLNFDKHKGYGTRAHREAIKKSRNITSIHRFSFKPIKK